MKITRRVTEVGDCVCCDICNDDYTSSTASGGFLFGSYAYCPKCAEAHIKGIRGHGEEKYIKEWCPPGLSYADWVRRIRYQTGSTQIIEITIET